jgi:hypothetical protein
MHIHKLFYFIQVRWHCSPSSAASLSIYAAKNLTRPTTIACPDPPTISRSTSAILRVLSISRRNWDMRRVAWTALIYRHFAACCLPLIDSRATGIVSSCRHPQSSAVPRHNHRPIFTSAQMCVLSCHRTRPLYRTESLHPPGSYTLRDQGHHKRDTLYNVTQNESSGFYKPNFGWRKVRKVLNWMLVRLSSI